MSQQSRMSGRWMAAPWRGLGAALLALTFAVAPTVARPTSSAAAARVATAPATYSNPVIPQTAPDPAIIKALDGYYYIMTTSDFWQDNSYHLVPTWRSTDLVNWTFVHDAFPSKPAWLGNGTIFAPDLQYFNHKYYMYYTASDTATGGSAIGVATAPSLTGPWTDSGGPIVGPRTCSYSGDPACHPQTIDPAEFTDQDGQKYLYFGTYYGGTLVQRLSADGLHVTGPEVEIGHWDRYEGTYVVRHDVGGKAYYYNFSSAANCCAGPNTAYSVEVSRATSPLGPFYDQNGYPMQQPGPDGAQGGGYPTLKQNGNRWQGVGHNALITDLSGRDWIVYHGVDKTNGWVNTAPVAVTYRQLLIDRLDWTADGWPTTNGGAGPSDGPMAAPSTTPIFGDNFNAASGCAAPGSGASLGSNWAARGSWSVASDAAGACANGGYVTQGATSGRATLVSRTVVPSGYRAECDARLEQAGANSRYGCLVSYRGGRYIAATLDPANNALVTQAYVGGVPFLRPVVTPLPAGFDHTDWHHLTIEQASGGGAPNLRGVTFRVTVSDSDRDPLAAQTRTFPLGILFRDGGVGLVTQDARADFDNVTAAALATTTVPAETTPPVGAALAAYSDEFNGSLGAQWSFVRPVTTQVVMGAQELEITADGDLYRDANNATNLVLENQPAGDYAVETKITFDPNSNYQQAGLLVYSDDDHYIKTGPFHGDSLNKILSGRETLEPAPSNAAVCDIARPAPGSNVAVTSYTRDQCPNEGESWDNLSNAQPITNGLTAQAPNVTDYLRIYRRGNVYQPYSSIDGVNWVKGVAWSLTAVDAAHPIKIGLFAFSAGSNQIPAFFDYVHVSSLPSGS